MKIDAYSANGAGRSLLLSRGAQQILRGGVFPGEVRIAEVVASVDQNGRPSLQLLGTVATLKVDGDEVAVTNSDLSMLWQYEFTRDQLVAMTQRGLLEKGLGEQPFNGLVGSVVELPVPTQLSMLSLNGTDYLFACREPFQAPPLITVDNCGYDLAPFFEPVAEINPLQARELLELERQAGFTGVDLLFDDEHELGGTLPADQPGQQGRADFVDEALRLVQPDGDALNNGGQVAPAAGPVSPEAEQLDQWFSATPKVRNFLDEPGADGFDEPETAEERRARTERDIRDGEAEAAERSEETRLVAERSRTAQGLGHTPSAYSRSPSYEAPATPEFAELEL